MSEFCNNLFFYDNPPIELSQIISSLKPHMYTNETILPDKQEKTNKVFSVEKSIVTNPRVKERVNLPTIETISPNQKDSLFWCFYIALHGLHEYDTIHNFFTKEKEIKYSWIEELRGKKEILKPIKISKATVEDELANCQRITMASVKAMCHLFDINIFYIDNKKFYEIITDENNPIFVIEKRDKVYGLKKNLTTEQLEYYRNHFWKLENLDKPLKAISSYKINDLRSICSKLHIEFVNMTRPQMYQAILSYL